MWAVVIVSTFYPSIYTFNSEVEARDFYVINKNQYGTIVHLVQIIESHVGDDCEDTVNKSIDWANLTKGSEQWFDIIMWRGEWYRWDMKYY